MLRPGQASSGFSRGQDDIPLDKGPQIVRSSRQKGASRWKWWNPTPKKCGLRST